MDLYIRSSDTPLHNIYNLRHTLTDRTVSVNQANKIIQKSYLFICHINLTEVLGDYLQMGIVLSHKTKSLTVDADYEWMDCSHYNRLNILISTQLPILFQWRSELSNLAVPPRHHFCLIFLYCWICSRPQYSWHTGWGWCNIA